METALVVTVAAFFATSVYMMLSTSLIRLLLGIAVLGNAVNLSIFIAGRVTRHDPPVIPAGLYQAAEPIVNPLPQALILTAIVIGFSLFAFLLVLAYRSYQTLGTDETHEMRVAEPLERPRPPTGY